MTQERLNTLAIKAITVLRNLHNLKSSMPCSCINWKEFCPTANEPAFTYFYDPCLFPACNLFFCTPQLVVKIKRLDKQTETK